MLQRDRFLEKGDSEKAAQGKKGLLGDQEGLVGEGRNQASIRGDSAIQGGAEKRGKPPRVCKRTIARSSNTDL